MPDTAPAPTPDQLPHPARIYDYFLGGNENLPADRAAADGIVKLLPGGPLGARANRRFLARAVRYASRQGIRQFLDVGSGIPAEQATHEVAPEARVVYVDNDPIVGDIARRLLGGAPGGRTAFVAEDFRNPEAALAAPEAKELLDLSQPVAVIFGALLHFVLDAEDPYAVVERYKSALAPGSLVILTHSSPDYVSAPVRAAVDELYTNLRVDLASRSRGEIERFVATEGWSVVAPGVVSVNEWETEQERADDADYQTNREDTAGFAAVAVKH
ncbi:SAM-dependent methyltransferase [Streptomyces actuosus]|uniref:SAM-dependent methyltransferase n=1 Tax=Streptomyces actuosus TaxID=1885 RepID=A0ABS2VZ50_STRAS|nr:SAM-dependent methyltransferase [Streptomyces actuosus]MBN0048319.1 SAM-dependent methyltransferase [Streptomyces actuosus]